jgi:hypothetical protein
MFTDVSEHVTVFISVFVSCLLLVDYSVDSHVDPEDDDRMFLRNVGASCTIVSRWNS